MVLLLDKTGTQTTFHCLVECKTITICTGGIVSKHSEIAEYIFRTQSVVCILSLYLCNVAPFSQTSGTSSYEVIVMIYSSLYLFFSSFWFAFGFNFS